MHTRYNGMTLEVSLTDREVSTDPVAALFRVSALVSDHVTRMRQAHVNRDIDFGQGIKGRIVSVDYKNITLKSASGERRTVPMTPKRAAHLAQMPTDTPANQSTRTATTPSSKRLSPRKQSHPPQAGATTRK